MEQSFIKLVGGKDLGPVPDQTARDTFVAQCLAAAQGDAAQGNEAEAFFDLGMAFSTGSDAVAIDLVEAHKWFNLAAVGGHEHAAQCRADVADDMTARDIAEAQRRAREWLRADPGRRVA
jgi:TPR repeat protein